MHQGLTAKILICLVLLLSTQANSQLNNSKEIIETVDDIKILDDTSSQKPTENPNKPKYDEEFGKQTTPVQKEVPEKENNIAEPETAPEEQPEKEIVERKNLEDEKGSYEDELQKNAKKIQRKELSPEELKNFEVDPVPKEQVTEPVVESPQETKPVETPIQTPEEEIQEEANAIPENPEEPKEVAAPVVEEEQEQPEQPGVPIQYEPEKTGPVIVYENEKILTDEQRENLSEKTKVEIEDDPYEVAGTKVEAKNTYLKSFKDRRPSWTYEFEIGTSMYEPENYLSDINPFETYSSFYTADTPLSNIGFDFKKNFSWGAISFGGAMSYYKASGGDATLTIMNPSARATLYLDTLFPEPYIVPYGTVGYSYMMYDEKGFNTVALQDDEFKGATDNIYVGAGVLFQLDWLDTSGDVSAYEDTGIENTFIFAEARTYLDQGIKRAEDDPDFSAAVHLAAGIKLEF